MSTGTDRKPTRNTKTVSKPAIVATSRFSGGGFRAPNVGKSQYKPMPIRITQHKG